MKLKLEKKTLKLFCSKQTLGTFSHQSLQNSFPGDTEAFHDPEKY